MGTSKSAFELGAKLDRFANVVPTVNRAGLQQAALFAKDAMNAGAVSIGGLKLGQPLPKAGKAKWGAAYKWRQGLTSRGPNSASDDVEMFYRGPVHWAESGTRPHFIVARGVGGSRKSRGRRAAAAEMFMMMAGGGSVSNPFAGLKGTKSSAKGAKALSLGNGQFAQWVRHPGTQGKHFWAPTVATIANGTPKVIHTAYAGALVRHFS